MLTTVQLLSIAHSRLKYGPYLEESLTITNDLVTDLVKRTDNNPVGVI